MLVQATSPRIVLHVAEHPQYIYVHTLCKPGVSPGTVLFGAYATGGQQPPGAQQPQDAPDSHALTVYRTTPVRSSHTQQLEPLNTYPIDGEDGFQALEYVVPFWELFREEDKSRNLALVPFCTGGFSVTIVSAFRSDPQHYDQRSIAFQILMPVTGGGILRMGDSMVDIANPTFDPWAPNPKRPWKNLELQDAYNRTHRLGDRAAINKRREERIRAAEASMAAEAEKSGRKMLPPKG